MHSKRVLVTGAGGAAAVSFLRAVASMEVTLFAADIDPLAAGLYLVPHGQRLLIPRADHPDFVPTLLAMCEHYGIDVLVPTVDTELLPVSNARVAFAQRGVAVMVAKASALRTCLDKAALMNAAAAVMPTPRTAIVTPALDRSCWPLPALAKPRQGAGGRGIVLVSNPADWDRVPTDGSYLVQTFLPGTEYSVDVLATPSGTPLIAVPRARLKVDSGVAVAARTVHDESLQRAAMDIVAALGLGWVSNVQLRRDPDGCARLLEINPRFPGTMPLTIAAGVDMPSWCLRRALGGAPPPPTGFRELAVVRHWEEVVLPVDAFDFVSPSSLAAK